MPICNTKNCALPFGDAQFLRIKNTSWETLSNEVIFLRNILVPLAGSIAGLANGLFGAGGGMVLVPLLGKAPNLNEQEQFPASVAIIAPICIVSLLFSPNRELSLGQILPYLLGSALGGIGAGLWGQRIPTVWLHRFLGVIILWGGIRYLC